MKVFGALLTLVAVSASGHEVDETAYLLQTKAKQKTAELEDCYMSGGCVTTTTTTTTTTAAPTTTTTTTTTAAPTTTTTTIPPTETFKDEPPPPDTNTDGDGDTEWKNYCTKRQMLDVSHLQYNNLGGMGPELSHPKELRYSKVTKAPDGSFVDLKITAPDAYTAANRRFRAKGTTGEQFIARYNGNRYRTTVMAIGSLGTGSFDLKFEFVKRTRRGDVQVVLPYVPLTFFDLDGETTRQGDSYEEVWTNDAEGTRYVDGTQIKHACKKMRGKQVCYGLSAREEIDIPHQFDKLNSETRKAAMTFLFKNKSEFTIKYKLNYVHRVFLFKGQCFK